MNKRAKTLLGILLLVISILNISYTVFAVENSYVSGKLSSTIAAKTGTPGWKSVGNYKYYYDKDGKMVTGWSIIDNKYYYFRTKAAGDIPAGSMVTGFLQIGDKNFYFDKAGYLRKCGWIKIKGQIYYLTTAGNIGEIGAVYTGLKKIDGAYYVFKDTGAAATGLYTVGTDTYYLSNSKKLGSRGKVKTGWQKIGSYKYYFNSSGILQKNKWIDKKYYVDADGRRLTKSVTPDLYYVNSSGKKQTSTKGWKSIGGAKYYFKSGKAVTGWKTIKSKKYYFSADGKMAVHTIIDGISIGADGVAVEKTEANTKSAKILIISGHGQGDVGAIGTHKNKKGKLLDTYYEYKYTREFASLIKSQLDAVKTNLSVTMYDQNYDCYQVIAKKKTGPDPNFKNYDYVLEIHFNAIVESKKDPVGDGNQVGIGMYINSAKKNTKLDEAIVKAAASVGKGFKIWGGGTGLMRSSTLLNAKTCQSKKVSYGLLETAFIDDYDDMTFYHTNREAMAKGIAQAIISYFS